MFGVLRNRDGRRWARGLLGAIFLTTGLAKVPHLREFSVALEGLTRLSFPVAAGVIVVEMVIGAMLLLGIRTRVAGIGALMLGGVFAGIQTGRLFYGVQSPCYCLGILGELPGGAELGLDLLLVALSMMVIRGKGAQPHSGRWSGSHAWLAVMIPLGFVSVPLALPDLPSLSRSHETVLLKVRAEHPGKLSPEKSIVLCLNLDEFHCSLCFDDLIALLDTLRAITPGTGRKDLAAAIRSLEPEDSCSWRHRRWARETGIDGPVAVLSAAEFDEATGGKSVLWLTRGMDRILQMWDLPLGTAGRTEVLASLQEP